MAAQEGSGYKILRVSMPLEKGQKSAKKCPAIHGTKGSVKESELNLLKAVFKVP
jgi:hypothetical protein